MRRLVLSLLALPLLLLGLAAPASAAPTFIAFTANGGSGTVTVAPDSTVTLAWNIEGDAELAVVASGDWTGPRDPSDTEDVAGPAAGESLTFTLTANDISGDPTAQSITVTADDDEAEGSTPPPVVVAECLVTVPESDDFTYDAVYDGDTDDTDQLEAGVYSVSELTSDGFFEVEIIAVAGEGVTVADGAVTSWEVTYSEECGANLIEATARPCSFEVENTSGGGLLIQYGDPEADDADGEFTLDAGDSRTVQTSREFLIVVALPEDFEDFETFQVLPLDISQDGCDGGGSGGDGPRWAVPVSAPAAGVSTAGVDAGAGRAPWLLGGLFVLLGLAGGAARTRASS